MRVLLPVDGSAHSTAAVDFVASRASLVGTEPEVQLLHVQFPVPLRAARAAGREMVDAYHRAQAEAVLEPARVRLRDAGLRVRYRWVVGSPGAVVSAAAARSRADMVVMGSHGHGALQGLLFGSVTQAVLAASSKPLLVVRAGQVPASESLRVSIAVDGSHYGLAATRYVLSHRALFGPAARFRLVHVVHAQEDATAFEAAVGPPSRLFDAAGVKVDIVRLVGNNAGDAIAADAQRARDDLVVMGSHGRGAMKALLLGSVSTRVAARGLTPLLLVRPRRREAPKPGA